MSREWKPGDVAIAAFPVWTTEPVTYVEARIARYADGWARLDRPDDFIDDDNRFQPADPRPLLVIDPEDREQVERLLESLRSMSFSAHTCGAFTCLQAALREFAKPTPPKPEEPTGLGAVVEDAEGMWWVLYTHPDSTAPWVCAETDAEWSDINAVRVLSEGWSE